MRIFAPFAVVVLLSTGFVGCEDPIELDPGCAEDRDCGVTERCFSGTCEVVVECDDEDDPDGDGRGDGCSAGPDCDEGDGTVFQSVELYVDGDRDGVGVGAPAAECIGLDVPEGFTITAPSADDCDDGDAAVFREVDLFTDGDGDGVGVGNATPICMAAEVPVGFTEVTPIEADCDDADATIFRTVSLFIDGDDDDVGVGAAVPTCIGEAVPAGFTDLAADDDDCDDADAARFALLNLHADTDGDGVGLGAVTLVCTDGTVPAGFTDVTPVTADCDDEDAARAPGNPEVCDGLDNGCSGVADDGDVCPCSVVRDDPLRPYLVCGQARSHAQARAFCERLPHYALAKIDDAAENTFLRGQGALDHWIGLTDIATEGVFLWDDGTTLDPALSGLFDSSEPNGNGDCIHIRGGGWSDQACEQRRGYVCEAHPERRDPGVGCVDGDADGFGQNCNSGADCDDTDPATFGFLTGFADNDEDGFTLNFEELACTNGTLPSTFATAPSATTDCDETDPGINTGCVGCFKRVHEGVTYEVCGNGRSWTNALVDCVGLGANLASLGTRAEGHYFKDLVTGFDPGVDNWWFGLNDRDPTPEGQFVWSDGSEVTYLDFTDGQPNNNNNQDCSRWQRSGWNDAPCSDSHRFVCER